MAKEFSYGLIDYINKKGYEKYWDMSSEELVDVLDEYANSPEYIPPKIENINN